MSDEVDDPFAEEDAAYEERVRLWREAEGRKWDSREGLIKLGTRPQKESIDGLRRSLPSARDAARLFELVEAELGERAVRDDWSTPTERCLLLRDPEQGEWFLPRRLLYLQTEHHKNPPIPVHFELPEHIKRIAARKAKNAPPADAEPPQDEGVVPLVAASGRPARLGIYEGAAQVELTYGDRGLFEEMCSTTGDMWAGSQAEREPFTLDPCAKPPRAPPLSMLLRDELVAEGVPLELLAKLVAELRPEVADKGRVYLPVVQPGTVTGTWWRGLRNLRAAEWDGALGAGAGWAVVDGWNGTAVATGPTLDAAFAAWKEQLSHVQPLPPVERPASPPVAAPEAEKPAEPAEPAEPAKVPENVAVASMGTIQIEIHPPVIMQWPEPRPENVPAVALPLPALPPVPEVLAALGFARVVRLFGELGDVGFAFLREAADGFTMVGDDALGALDIEAMDDEIARVDARSRDEWVDCFGKGNPFVNPSYPVLVIGYRVWDDLGRNAQFRDGGVGQMSETSPTSWDLPHRHVVTRVQVLPRGR